LDAEAEEIVIIKQGEKSQFKPATMLTMADYNAETINAVARVMAESFMEDPMNRAVLEGLEKTDELMKSHSRLHTRHAIQTGMLRLLDGNPGAFLIGLDSRDASRLDDWKLIVRIYAASVRALGFRDIRRLFSNSRKTGSVLSFSWEKEFIKGRYYRIKIVAVDKSMRGQGAFRRMVTPLIEFSDTEQVPLIIETHNEDNVGLYRKFGFELVKTITSPRTEIQQYCMIRWPATVMEA
jgi:ribosomal protein S18 acetylase RimI-like enzyme